MEDISEIGAIWRGETRRALKSGRVLVLLILFLLFVGLALTGVGIVNHLVNAQFDQLALSGGDVDRGREELVSTKKKWLQLVVTEDEAMLDSLATIPIVLLVVFKLTLRFLPLFIALMGFDQLAGEVGPRSVRYLVVRVVKQGSISLVLNVIALFLIWFVALIGGWVRFPGEVAAQGTLAMLKAESAWAYIRYASVWHYGDELLHPHWGRFLTASLVHVGFGLVFLGLAQLALRRRDL